MDPRSPPAGAPRRFGALCLDPSRSAASRGELGEGPSDYWSPLAPPELREKVAAAVAEELVRRRRQWDVLIVKRLPASDALEPALLSTPLRARRQLPVPCQAIQLPKTFDDYLAAMPKSRQSDLRRHLKRLDEGAVTLRGVRDVDERKRSIEQWQRLRVTHCRSMGKDLDPEHRSDRFRAFIPDATCELVPRGPALVWEFMRRDEVVGCT